MASSMSAVAISNLLLTCQRNMKERSCKLHGAFRLAPSNNMSFWYCVSQDWVRICHTGPLIFLSPIPRAWAALYSSHVAPKFVTSDVTINSPIHPVAGSKVLVNRENILVMVVNRSSIVKENIKTVALKVCWMVCHFFKIGLNVSGTPTCWLVLLPPEKSITNAFKLLT